MSAEIIGAKEIGDKLIELDKKVAKQIASGGLRDGAKDMLPIVQAEAPVRSGETRAKIKVRAAKAKNAVAVSVGLDAKWFHGSKDNAGNFYPAFVMFGHAMGPRELGSARKMIAPDPFLERGYDKAVTQTVSTIESSLVKRIEEAAKE